MATNKAGVKELAQSLMQEYNLSKADAEKFVQTMFEIVNNGLINDKLVKVKGLGTFKVTSIASRRSIDVNTGEPIVIEGRDKISYMPDAQMRDLVNRPFSQFETVVVNDGVDFSEIDRKFADDPQAGLSEVDEFLEKYEPTQEKSSTADTDAKSDPVTDTNTQKKEVKPEEKEETETDKKEVETNKENSETGKESVKQEGTENTSETGTPLRLSAAQLSMLNGDNVTLDTEEEPETESAPLSENTEEPGTPHAFILTPYQLSVLNSPNGRRTNPVPTQEANASQSLMAQGEQPSVAQNAQTPLTQGNLTSLPQAEQEDEVQAHANEDSPTQGEDNTSTTDSEPATLKGNVQEKTASESPTTSGEQLTAEDETPKGTAQQVSETDEPKGESSVQSPSPTTELLEKEINRSHRLIKWMVACVAFLVVASAAAMFYLFGQLNRRDNRIRHLETSAVMKRSSANATSNAINKAALSRSRDDSARIAKEVAQLDTISAARNARHNASAERQANIKQGSPTVAKAQQTTKQQVAQKQVADKKQASKADLQSSVYDKDPRVRTGAYRIIGVDRLFTVRKGQTLHSISRSTLGPGMECYIEAVNDGRTEFKEGEKIKIPKLKLKRKK